MISAVIAGIASFIQRMLCQSAAHRTYLCGGILLFLSFLQDFIEKRHEEMPEGSYTTKLFKDGLNRMAQKFGEESLEAVIEATNGTDEKFVYEVSDMFYHLIVLLTSKGLRIEDVARELQMRHDPNWDKQRRQAKSEGKME